MRKALRDKLSAGGTKRSRDLPHFPACKVCCTGKSLACCYHAMSLSYSTDLRFKRRVSISQMTLYEAFDDQAAGTDRTKKTS